MGTFLAFDFGAGSGRAIVGRLSENRLNLEEIHRFENTITRRDGHDYWDIHALFKEVKIGLRKCAELKIRPQSIGIDTWGVDFALLDKNGEILDLPFAYRDGRTRGMFDYVFDLIDKNTLYEKTGIQFLELNTLYQLASMIRDKSPLLEQAKDLLFIPDIFHYFLTGEKKSEFTFATTSQLYSPNLQNWDEEIFLRVGIDVNLMQKTIKPSSVIGDLTDEIALETGIEKCKVVAVGTHDTASAIAAVPAEKNDWAYISSGTWSLMGFEADKPVINEKALKYNFTNEGGVGDRFRVLKNISGMWLIQQCKIIWDEKETISFEEIVKQAEKAEPFRSLINPDDESFVNPENMVQAIGRYCRKSEQPVPHSIGSMARCIFESLALKYRKTLSEIREISLETINRVYIIGGGTQNELLNQFAANACGVCVYTGPIEATAIGNILVQAMANGEVSNLDELRQIVGNSFEVKRYDPLNTDNWSKAYKRFCNPG